MKVETSLLSDSMSIPEERAPLGANLPGGAQPGPIGPAVVAAQQREVPARMFKRKRATDLMLPPEVGFKSEELLLNRDERLLLLAELPAAHHTGCLITTNDKTESRGAILMYRGRVAGAVYTSRLIPETQPTEASLKLIMSDFHAPATKIQKYPVADSKAIAMSALFLGKPLLRSDDLSARGYFDFILAKLAQEHQTGCISIHLGSTNGTCLVLVHMGFFVGAFYVDQSLVTNDITFVYGLIDGDATAAVHACMFSPDMTPSNPDFGFHLG